MLRASLFVTLGATYLRKAAGAREERAERDARAARSCVLHRAMGSKATAGIAAGLDGQGQWQLSAFRECFGDDGASPLPSEMTLLPKQRLHMPCPKSKSESKVTRRSFCDGWRREHSIERDA